MEKIDLITYKKMKWVFASKTFWLNTIVGVVSFGIAVAEIIRDAQLLPEGWGQWVAVSLTIANLFLRYITDSGVSVRRPTADTHVEKVEHVAADQIGSDLPEGKLE